MLSNCTVGRRQLCRDLYSFKLLIQHNGVRRLCGKSKSIEERQENKGMSIQHYDFIGYNVSI